MMLIGWIPLLDFTVTCTLSNLTLFLCCSSGLWGILNNAGTSGQYLGPPEFFTMDDYKHVVDVNLMGMVEVNHIFAPLVKKAKGRIVNTSSIGGIFANRYSAPYTISKFAVEGYSDTLRWACGDIRPHPVPSATLFHLLFSLLIGWLQEGAAAIWSECSHHRTCCLPNWMHCKSQR